MAATGLTVVHPVAGWQKTANTTAGEGPKPFSTRTQILDLT